MADIYIDGDSGDDSNGGTGPTDALKTWGVATFGAWTEVGDIVFIAGTLRERVGRATLPDNCSLKQTPGGAQMVVRGDTILDKTTAASTIANLYEFSLPPDTCDNVNNRTLPEGLSTVIGNWDASIDFRGRHYGHFERAQSLANIQSVVDPRQNSWWFEPAGVAGVNQDGSGTLYIRTGTGEFASLAAFKASALILAYCVANRNGIEIGTQRYSDGHFTQDSDVNSVVNGFTIDGAHSYLWPDNGWRSQYGGGGLGVDVGAVTCQVNSMGYAIRPADWVGGTCKNVVTIDGGYHGLMFVGQRNANNTFRDSTIYGGNGNQLSGGSSGGFYCSDYGNGSKNISGCRAQSVVNHKYTLLGRTVETVSGHSYAIPIPVPFFNASAVAITVTAASAANPCVLTLSSAMPAPYTGAGDKFWIALRNKTVDLATATAIAYEATIIDTTHVSIRFDNSGGTTVGVAGLGVFANYDGFICHTNATASNRVLDIEYTDLITYESGCESLGALCVGSAYKGGALGPASLPATGTTPSLYPVRFTRCNVYNAAYNVTDSDISIAYTNCRFHLDRHGICGSVGNGTSGALGSGSGAQYVLYTGCEIVDTMGNSFSAARATLNASLTNRIYVVNCSIYGLGTGTNSKYLFNFISGDPAYTPGSYVYAKGSIFGYKSDAGGTVQLLVMGETPSAVNLNQTNFDAESNVYFGPAGYIPVGFPGPNTFTSWFTGWQGTGIDQTGIDNGTTNTYADTTGAGLALTTAAKIPKKSITPHTAQGINLMGYASNYGAFQYPAGSFRAARGGGRRGRPLMGVR